MLKEFLEGRIQTLYRAEVDAETFSLNEHKSDSKSYNNSEAKGSHNKSINNNYGKQKKVTANVANMTSKKPNNSPASQTCAFCKENHFVGHCK